MLSLVCMPFSWLHKQPGKVTGLQLSSHVPAASCQRLQLSAAGHDGHAVSHWGCGSQGHGRSIQTGASEPHMDPGLRRWSQWENRLRYLDRGRGSRGVKACQRHDSRASHVQDAHGAELAARSMRPARQA